MGRINKLPSGLQFDGENYIVDKWVDRKRIKKRLGPVSRKEAEEILAQLITDAKRGELVSASASSLTVNDLLRYYYEHKLKHLASGKDAKWHIPTISRLIGTYRVMDLKKSDIEQFKRMRGAEKNKKRDLISPRTIQAELQLLTMAIKYAIGDRLIPSNPVDGLCGVEVPDKEIFVLDDCIDQGEEWTALYEAIPQHWKLFCLIGYEAGLRPSEVENFHAEWVHDIGDCYMIKIPAIDEKTDKCNRRIPVSRRLEQDLIPFLEGKTGKIFEHTDYNKMIRKAVKESGINQEIKMKSLRKTRLSIWDDMDKNAARIAGGHVPIDVHDRSYAKVNNARLMRLVGIELDNKLKLFKQA